MSYMPRQQWSSRRMFDNNGLSGKMFEFKAVELEIDSIDDRNSWILIILAIYSAYHYI